METLKVIFRAERSGPHKGEVTAVFPTVDEGANMFGVYARVGQHSTGSRGWYRSTRPAQPAEYASLLCEIKRIYETGEGAVSLEIAKRFPSRA